jgi:hypothetical protein
MIKNSAVRGALCAGMLALALAAPLCSAQTDASQPTSPDISKRVEDLEKQLADLKAQLAAQKAAEPAAAPATPPASAAVATTTPAPTPAPTGLAGLLGPTTISGFVDTYYGYNSNQPSTRTNAFRNFDINSAQFGLNMIELVADKAPDATASRVGYHIAVGFGQAINQVNATEPGPGYPATTTTTNFDQYLKEGYLEYLAPVGKGLQLNVGKFVTPAGAEVIESKDNWNYTRGILFAWAIPYFHFGMSGKYTFSSKFALTGYLVNGWNNSVDNNSGKTTGFSAAWTPNSKFTLIQNYLVGPEQTDINGNFRHLYDAVLIYNPNAKLSLMANYDYGHDRPFGGPSSVHWSGIAGYIKYAMNDKWSVAGRGEYFNDHDGFETGTTQNLSEFTFTLQRMLASKIISRLEFRRDMSSADTFPYRSGPPAYGPTDAQNTVTVGLIYAFSSADAK